MTDLLPEETKNWRCFHCDDVFTSEVDARAHFGRGEAAEPACRIKAAGEFALLQALRNAEDDLARYRNEDSDVLRAMWSMQSDHAQALRREEEKGYACGLRDASTAERSLWYAHAEDGRVYIVGGNDKEDARQRWIEAAKDEPLYIGSDLRPLGSGSFRGVITFNVRCGEESPPLDSDAEVFTRAIVAGVARWEYFSGSTDQGEVCVGGLRYATNLDVGVPVLGSSLREALERHTCWRLNRGTSNV